MYTMSQLLAHLAGDYVIQTDHMAQRKRASKRVAAAHAASYTLPFLFLTRSWRALSVIAGTHYLIDHYGLARYVCWAKNQLAPAEEIKEVIHQEVPRWVGDPTPPVMPVTLTRQRWRYPFKDGDKFGYRNDSPAFLSLWLLIIADNFLHLVINGWAISKLGRKR